jgi:hypothetical protein
MTRFSVLALFLLTSFAPVFADAPAAKTGTAMIASTQALLNSLTDEQRKTASMDFDNPARMDWHNIPKPERKGLQYRDMTAEQRKLCLALLKSALSEDGFKKATTILSLENNLKEGEKNQTGTPFRDPERYFFTVFGKPAADQKWGWSFEGQHLSLNFVISGGNVIADTPSFWGSNPATVKVFVEGGPAVGTRNLANEEQLAFDLVNSLNDEQRKAAITAKEAPAEYRNAGVPQAPQTAPEGLQATKLNDQQKETLWKLLSVYCNHFASDVAAHDLELLKSDGWDRVYFCWQGSTEPGVGHYYRVQGPTYILEFINVQPDPAGNKANHIHSVLRNIKGDFAVAVGQEPKAAKSSN